MFRNLTEAIDYLGARESRRVPSIRSTQVVRVELSDSTYGVGIKYHNTVVATYTESGIILDTGGFYTVTTKARMNSVLWKAGLPSVSQYRKIWYLGKVPFVDEIMITYAGEIITPDDAKARAIQQNQRALLVRAIGKRVSQMTHYQIKKWMQDHPLLTFDALEYRHSIALWDDILYLFQNDFMRPYSFYGQDLGNKFAEMSLIPYLSFIAGVPR